MAMPVQARSDAPAASSVALRRHAVALIAPGFMPFPCIFQGLIRTDVAHRRYSAGARIGFGAE